MAKFRGRFDFSIDQKGRINIPSKFRKLLSPAAEETFVVCRAPDGCLWAYPKDEWEKFEDTLEKMPMSRDVNRFQRTLQNTVSDSAIDKQGRISLTPLQMKIAGINKNVSIVGRGNYLEIWDTQQFEAYISGGEDFDKVYYETYRSGLKPAE
ncbi:MAG: division/cell wall cluster transcriptional repressor MraZ [Acidobacteriota bacterium]|jgi:MraZ protein|nr:division/cell wall cluster transcriptional repressor MraZ [Acidobacteriota bacterium]